MKLFLWKNENSSSDFDDNYIKNFYAHDSSNAHSGGAVILAENKDDAFELLKNVNGFDIRDEEMGIDISPIEIPFDRKGVVIFCDGDC